MRTNQMTIAHSPNFDITRRHFLQECRVGVGKMALALVRIDKSKNAMDTGTEILAGDVPISLTLSPNVTFSWPETLSMDE